MMEMHEAGDVQLDKVGATSLSFWAEMLRRADKDFGALEAREYQHVKYENLVRDPVGTVKQVYASFGWAFTKAYEDKLVAYIAANKAERAKQASTGKAMHSYSLEQFGLDDAAIAKECAWYSKKFL